MRILTTFIFFCCSCIMNAQCVNLSYWMDAVPDATTYYQVIDNAGGTLSNSDLVGNDPCVDFELFGCGQYIIEAIDTSLTCTNCEVRDTIYPYYCCEIFVTFENDTVLCDGTLASSTATATGGDGGPYTYLWSDAQTTNPAVQLDTGDYILEVTDFIGCVDSFYTTIVAEEDCESPCNCTPLLFNTGGICDRVTGTRFGSDCNEYETCYRIINGVQTTINCNNFFLTNLNDGDEIIYCIQDLDMDCSNDIVCDTIFINCGTDCDCTPQINITPLCLMTWGVSGTGCGNYTSFEINNQPVNSSGAQTVTNGTYTFSIDGNLCPEETASASTTFCGTTDCTGCATQSFTQNNCVLAWNNCLNGWTETLTLVGVGTITPSGSGTHTATVNGTYELTWSKAGCTPITLTQVVTNCEPVVDCNCTPFINEVNCVVTYGVSGTGCGNYDTYLLDGFPASSSGSFTATTNTTHTFSIQDLSGGTNCATQGATVPVTCAPPDCTGCVNPTVSFVNCNVTHTVCPNGWIATIYLQGTTTVVDSDNDGSFTASDGVAYDIRWEKAGCTTIQQGFTTTCPTVDCTGCANPTVTVNGCDVTHTVCTNGWVANIYLQSNGSLVDSDNDGFFTGQNGINYIIRWTKPGCGTNLQVFSTSCTIVCTDCPNPTATSDDDCMVSYTDCPGRTVLVNGLAPTSNPFQGAPNTTYNFTWSKAGCPDETASVTTDPPTADIDFGDPVVTFECSGVGSGAVVVSFPDFTADCVCCEDLTLVVWANSIINGTTSTQVYSHVIEPCSGDPVEINAVGLECLSIPTSYPQTYQFFYGPTRFELNPNNCGLTVDFGGVSNALTVTQAMATSCCVNGLSDMIGDPIDAEELQRIRQQEIQKNKNQEWPFMACVLFAILILFGASSIYKPK